MFPKEEWGLNDKEACVSRVADLDPEGGHNAKFGPTCPLCRAFVEDALKAPN